MAKKNKKAAKKTKSKRVRFYGLNVTLQSKERKGTKTYYDLIKRIYDDSIVVNLGSEKRVLFRNQFGTKFEYENKKYDVLYGKLLRFTVIDTKNWYHQKSKILQDYELPPDIAPNAFETDYIFIPEAHRFFIRYNNKVNINIARIFIEKSLNKLLVLGEEIHVNIISSKDVIDAIMDAKNITNLTINVSYTNDDIAKDAKELIDDMLKKAHAGEAGVNFKPDATGTLDSKSNLISGFLGVAKENGNATATILNEKGRRKTINTSDHPEKISIIVKETDGKQEDEKKILFDKIMEEYRKKDD